MSAIKWIFFALITFLFIFGCIEPKEISDCKEEAKLFYGNMKYPQTIHEEIMGFATINNCIRKKAVESQNKGLCDYIESESIKNDCLSSFNE